jgi:peptide-methionine (S)-S-oxide reductase
MFWSEHGDLAMPRPLLILAATLIALTAGASRTSAETAIATFAGGCFWCVESDFDHVPGVLETVSGYTGGTSQNPDYNDHSGHREAVQITYDPAKVTYERLLHVFWRSVDPTDKHGQFCDRGHSYSTAIYANSEEQLKDAKASKAELEKSGKMKRIATEIEMAGIFWKAEDYHQDYYKKNPYRYNYYRFACGRDHRLKEVWGDESLDGIEGH